MMSLSCTCCLSLLHMAQVPFGCPGGSSLNCHLTGNLLRSHLKYCTSLIDTKSLNLIDYFLCIVHLCINIIYQLVTRRTILLQINYFYSLPFLAFKDIFLQINCFLSYKTIFNTCIYILSFKLYFFHLSL